MSEQRGRGHILPRGLWRAAVSPGSLEAPLPLVSLCTGHALPGTADAG